MKRAKRKSPCPICGGFDEQARGKSKRCHGFLSDNEEWAHCTREEFAGSLPMHPNSQTYAHWLNGECKCGVLHSKGKAKVGSQKSKSSVLHTYDYVDEQAQLLYQVCKCEPKGFFQRRPDGNGGWINKVTGVRRVLYRLPDLISADKSKQVFVCEGEKDCDALRGLGLLGTTNSGGAKKWNDEFSETLGGRNVVILPDNDDVGREHAEHVAKSLYDVALSVRIVELPGLLKSGDVSDWLASGGSAEKLLELASTSPLFINQTTPKESDEELICVADVEVKEVEWLWHPYIPLGKLTMFDGDPGIGKSFCTCAIAAAVSRGSGLPNMSTRPPASVLMLSAEDGVADTITPRLVGLSADVERIFVPKKSITLDDQGFQRFEKLVSQAKPSLVVIDPLFAFVGGKKDIYRDNEVRDITTRLWEIAEKYNCAIVALRHLTKQQQKSIYAGSGSIGIIGAARSALLFGKAGNEKGFVHNKANLTQEGPAIGFSIENGADGRGHFAWAEYCSLTREKILCSPDFDSSRQTKEDSAVAFLEDILAEGSITYKEIHRKSQRRGISEATLRRAKVRLGVTSYREKAGVGPWYWRLPGSESESSPSFSSDEHVVAQPLTRVITEVSSEAQDCGIERVVSESTPSNDYVDERVLTSANKLLTDKKADAQNYLLENDHEAGILEVDSEFKRRLDEQQFQNQIPQVTEACIAA